MPTYARGVARSIVFAPELVTYGTQGAGPGQLLRRTNMSMDLQVQAIESAEINPDAQLVDARHGPQLLQGQIAGQLSPGTYKSLFEGLLRGTWTAGAFTAAITATLTVSSGIGTLTAAAVDLFAGGFKKGDVIRFSGLVSDAVPQNSINFRITNVALHVITIAPHPLLITWVAAQTAVVMTVVGKKLTTPVYASQVYRSYTAEDWKADISESKLGLGIRVVQGAINIPAAGFTTLGLTYSGQTMTKSGSRVYASPTAASTSSGVTGVNGKVSYAGVDLAYITAANVNIAAAAQPIQAVGNALTTDIVLGMITARGTISALSTADSMTADFLAETELDLSFYLTGGGGNAADFVSIYMGRVKLQAASEQDSQTAIMRNYNFSALRQTGGGTGTAWDDTTLVMQDSLA